MFDLSGKAALVTGASGGIGGAIARALHAQGAVVTLSGTRAEALEQLRRALGERAHVVAARMDDPADGGGPRPASLGRCAEDEFATVAR